jgi:hypothetical protein
MNASRLRLRTDMVVRQAFLSRLLIYFVDRVESFVAALWRGRLGFAVE